MQESPIDLILKVSEIRVARQIRQVKNAETHKTNAKHKVQETESEVKSFYQAWSQEKKELQEDLFSKPFGILEIQKKRDQVAKKEETLENKKTQLKDCKVELKEAENYLKQEQLNLLNQRKRLEKMKEAHYLFQQS